MFLRDHFTASVSPCKHNFLNENRGLLCVHIPIMLIIFLLFLPLYFTFLIPSVLLNPSYVLWRTNNSAKPMLKLHPYCKPTTLSLLIRMALLVLFPVNRR